jgi:hypothetical protein
VASESRNTGFCVIARAGTQDNGHRVVPWMGRKGNDVGGVGELSDNLLV